MYTGVYWRFQVSKLMYESVGIGYLNLMLDYLSGSRHYVAVEEIKFLVFFYLILVQGYLSHP